jgi:hypothetical protein
MAALFLVLINFNGFVNITAHFAFEMSDAAFQL